MQIGEYDSISKLNGIAEKISELNEKEQKIVKALISEQIYTVDEAIEKVNNCDYMMYYDCEDITDVVYQIVEAGEYLKNVPENVARYFDYEAFGRDLQLENTFIFLENNEVIEVF